MKNVYLFRSLLPNLHEKNNFTAQHVFELSAIGKPILFLLDTNILSEENIILNASKNGLEQVKKELQKGVEALNKQGFAFPNLSLLPVTLATEGTSHLLESYYKNYKELNRYFDIDTPLSKRMVTEDIPNENKSIDALKKFASYDLFLDTYFITLLMFYSTKRFLHAKKINLIPKRKTEIDGNVLAVCCFLNELIKRIDIIDATSLRLVQYFFSPEFEIPKTGTNENTFKDNFFKSVNTPSSKKMKEKAWNVAVDIALLKVPLFTGTNFWIMTGDRGLSLAGEYLTSTIYNKQLAWAIDLNQPPYNTAYWKKTTEILQDFEKNRKKINSSNYKIGDLGKKINTLLIEIDEFYKNHNMNGFGFMFPNESKVEIKYTE